MSKLFAVTFIAIALSACSSMSGTQSMGSSANPAETKNSTDANKAGNPAAVSPAPGAASGSGSGSGTR
jgi:hypothetical protein